MDIEACYRNFMFSSQSSNNFASKKPCTDSIVKECAVLEENIVFPVPNHVTSVEFARYMISDQDFQVNSQSFKTWLLTMWILYVNNLPRIKMNHSTLSIWATFLLNIRRGFKICLECNHSTPLNATITRFYCVCWHLLVAILIVPAKLVFLRINEFFLMFLIWFAFLKGEIEAVMNLGVTADRIIYANPCKTASYIKHAALRNVRMMTFDNEQELYKINNLYPDAE